MPSITSRSRHLALASLALGFGIANACYPGPAAVRRFVGCYEVAVGNWNRATIEPPISYVPPDTVWLDPVPVFGRGITPGYQVRPNIFPFPVPSDADFPPKWELIGDTVRIAWNNGFAGVVLFVTMSGSRLVGRAVAFDDVIREEQLPNGTLRRLPGPTAHVRMRRIKCPMLRPNQRLKLPARGGRLIRNGSILIAAAAGRSLSAIR
jgi:hypothetical protein